MMTRQSKSLCLGGDDQKPFNGHLVMPTALPAPAVVVGQEILGITPFIESVCAMLADAGFIALAPDLFWREAPGMVLDGKNDDDVAKGRDTAMAIGPETLTADCVTAANAVKGLAECTGRAGFVGYCLGGMLAYRMAMQPECDAAVSYYGTRMHEMLDLAMEVRKPLMLHIATADALCPPEAQAKIKEVLGGRENVTIHEYDGAGHAFARESGSNYDPQATKLANDRTIDFFKTHLG